MSTHQGLTITELESAVQRVDGLFECTCGRYTPKQTSAREGLQNNFVTSDVLPGALFCSIECRNEAEQAAEDARRSDRVQR